MQIISFVDIVWTGLLIVIKLSFIEQRTQRTLRIGTSQFDDQKSRLRWFGHVERKNDNDWVKRCLTWEVEGIRQTRCPKKIWWDCVKNNMESLGLSQKDAV